MPMRDYSYIRFERRANWKTLVSDSASIVLLVHSLCDTGRGMTWDAFAGKHNPVNLTLHGRLFLSFFGFFPLPAGWLVGGDVQHSPGFAA